MLSCSYTKPADHLIGGFFLCLLLFHSPLSKAEPGTPFLTRNQSPLSLIYGIPTATPARLLEQNRNRWINSLNISNTSISKKGPNDHLFIDLETWQLNLFYDLGLSHNRMFRVQLPIVAHSGGLLDSAIDSYHRATHLPEGNRPDLPHNQIDINYTRNNINQLDISNTQKDIGDIALQLAWQTTKTGSYAISYWSSLKLPTGDHSKLTGSGGTDIATWIAMDYQLKDSYWLFGNAGLIYMHHNKVLPQIHNNWATFTTTGIKFQPWTSIELKAQFEFHSALFDTKIGFMQDIYQLTFGGSYLINEKHKIDFAVGEDINPGTSPDVAFNLSWWLNF